jgi:hypothetical protein
MASATPHPWPHLAAPLEHLLRAAPEGLSEFDLIRRLQTARDCPEFGAESLRDPLSLFRTHFILFHSLYRLADDLAAGGETVQVHCLRCRIVPAPGTAASRSLQQPNPVRGYYLDAANLEREDADSVERMMGAFWRQFLRQDRRAEALAVLGLSDPVRRPEIKAAYRRLVMRHHPDRGGDTATLQRLNEALAILDP